MADGSLIFDTKVDSSGFDGVAKIAAVSAAAISAAFGGAAVAAVKVGSDFEAGMDKVAAISGATATDIAQLTAKAEEMGAATKFTATEASEALNYMAQAGWKTSQMLDGIGGVMSLAAASGEDLASVSDIVTDSLTAFGLEASDCARFSDVLAMAANASNTDVAKMGATFKYVAPLAGAMRYSIEDTAVAIGLMANAGIKGEMAGTALRQMFTRLANPPKDAAMAMDALKISITNTDGNIKPLNETLAALREKFAGLSDAQKTEYAANLAGQEAMSGLLAIVNASDEDFQNLTDSISKSSGTAEEMAEIMQDNLKGQLTILGSSLEAVGITAYSKFQAPMKTAVETVIGNVNRLNNDLKSGKLSASMDKIGNSFAYCAAKVANFATDKALPALINGFAWIIDHGQGIAAAISTVGTAIVVYTGYVKAAAIATAIQTKAQALLNGTMLANPVGILIAAVAALTVGIMALANQTTEGEKKLELYNDEMERAKEAGRQIIDSSENEIASLELKAKTYEELRLKVNKTTGEEEALKTVAEELQAVLPEGTQLIDDQAVAYRALGGSIDEVVTKMRAQAQMNSIKTEYDEVNTQIRKLEKDKQDAINQMIEDNKYAEEHPILWALKTGGQQAESSMNFDTAVKGLAEKKALREALEQETKNLLVASKENNKKQSDSAEETAEAVFDAFKFQADTMKKQVSVGELTEAQYHANLSKMLTDANVDKLGAYNEYYAEVYSYQKSADEKAQSESEMANSKALSTAKKSGAALAKEQEKIFKAWSSGVSELVDDTTKGFNEIVNRRSAMQAKLESYGGLFERKKLDEDKEETTVVLNDLSEITAKLEEYQAALEQLRASGASSSFLQEVTAMGVDDGLDFAKALNEKSSSELESYLETWQKNKDMAKEIADDFYAKELESLQIGFVDKFNAMLEVMPKNLTAIGVDTMQGFIDGLNSKLSEVTKLSEIIAKTVAGSFGGKLEINSPSRVFRRFGMNTMDGYILGIDSREDDVMQSMDNICGSVTNSAKGLNAAISAQFSADDSIAKMQSAVGGQAANIFANVAGTVNLKAAVPTLPTSKNISVLQNINSPKAVSALDANRELRALEQRLARW